MTDLKEHGVSISISSVLSIGALGSMMWFVLQPVMISQMSIALADEMEEQIEQKTAPISGAFRVLLLSDINRLKRNIAKLEYKQNHRPDEYTEADATRLTDYKIELEAYQEAYVGLK